MATFVYYWKSPDNKRHEGEIEAKDRDTAFATLRTQGIRAIKVEPKGWETGIGYQGVRKRMVVGLAFAAALAAAGIVYVLVGRGDKRTTSPTVGTPQGQQTFLRSLAEPLERQQIFGNRLRIENIPPHLFKYPAETVLAHFAEPGRPIAATRLVPPTEAELRSCLRDPIHIDSNELTEHIDLKRIVAGIKRDLAGFLADGGTGAQYFVELVKRQKLEIAYRGKAETRLGELLKEIPQSQDPKAAYAYWLKANAQLKSMGIYELPLPERLRAYQLALDIDE